MTKESLNELKRVVLDSQGVYINSTMLLNINTIKDFTRVCLHYVPDTKIVEIYCSKKTKIRLMEYFILDGFNYLGMRVSIESSVAFESDNFELLVMADTKAIGWLSEELN